jgi:hypothetical protein
MDTKHLEVICSKKNHVHSIANKHRRRLDIFELERTLFISDIDVRYTGSNLKKTICLNNVKRK